VGETSPFYQSLGRAKLYVQDEHVQPVQACDAASVSLKSGHQDLVDHGS
jgi:hypothetical protein